MTQILTPPEDLSLIYSEIYHLARDTCHMPEETAQRWAAWYAATGGHIEPLIGESK